MTTIEAAPATVHRGEHDLPFVHFTDTIDALDTGTLDPRAMITETIDLDRLPARFAALAREPDGGKVVVRP